MAGASPRPALVVTTGFDEYQRELVAGVLPVLSPRGPVLVVSSFDPAGRRTPPPVVQILQRMALYGVIATTCATVSEERALTALLDTLEVPVVRIGLVGSRASCVRGDDASGMRSLMAHLLDERGMRRPVLSRGNLDHPDSIRREHVFRAEMVKRGLTVDEDLIIQGSFWHESTYRELRALLSRRRDMDAVVAGNDLSALGALKALQDGGLRVPDDVMVTGFDNDQSSGFTWPALTTVDPDLRGQGEGAARQLMAEVAGAAPVKEILVPSCLVIRGSTGPLEGYSDSDERAAAVENARTAHRQLATRDAMDALDLALSTCTTPQDVAFALASSHLSRLGISRCFLAVYAPRPGIGASVPDLRARLLLDYRNGIERPAPDEAYPIQQLLPTALRGELDAGFLIFQPLSSADHDLGYLLFEQEHTSGQVAHGLRIELSRTLEAIFSTESLKKYAEDLERIVAERTVQLQESNRELQRLAMSDGLTQLANRTALENHLGEQWKLLTQTGGELALIIADVDLFKAYNDQYGHLIGDQALRVVASRLAQSARYPHDLASRYGGEEFVLALPGAGLESALVVTQRFQALLADAAIPHAASTVAPVVTVSVGVACAQACQGIDPWILLEQADQALYRAKAQGRNRVCWTELSTSSAGRLSTLRSGSGSGTGGGSESGSDNASDNDNDSDNASDNASAAGRQI